MDEDIFPIKFNPTLRVSEQSNWFAISAQLVKKPSEGYKTDP